MPLASYLDQFPLIGERVYLHESAQVIGDVTMGEDCSVWCNAVIRGDVNRIAIGRCSNVQDGAVCHVSHKNATRPDGAPLVIGDYVSIAHAVVVHGCRIGNECLIGTGAIIMDDVVMQDRVMVGAGSLVPPGKTLESGKLYLGNPARAVRDLTPEEIGNLRYIAEHYVRVKNNYLLAARQKHI
jgi:carbonic anhydrase/acetyltransferase-like protein (isoleucine patch superfamily)